MINLVSDITKLCFDDYDVISMNLDADKRKMEILTNGADLLGKRNTNLKLVKIEIEEWEKIKISKFSMNNKKIERQDIDSPDCLEQLNEIKFNGSLSLSGFGKRTGEWTTYEFLSPKFQIFVEY